MSRRWVLPDWNFWPDGLDRAYTAATVASLGAQALEVGVYDPAVELSEQAVQEWTDAMATTGLAVDAVLFSMPPARWPDGGLATSPVTHRAVELIAATAARAPRLGATVLGLWPGADLAGPDGDRGPWRQLVAALAEVGDIAAASDLRVAVEYKPQTLLPDADATLRLLDDVDSAHVGALLDTGHALWAGEDLATVVDRLGSSLVHVHLGDSPGDAEADLPPGQVTSFEPFLAAVDAIGYTGGLSFDLYEAVASGAWTGERACASGLAHLRAADAALTGRP